MGDTIMIWGLVDFIKKILVNMFIHICWFMVYFVFSVMGELLGTSLIEEFLYELGYLYWEYTLVSIPITSIIFLRIIVRAYKKNPCISKVEKCLYWIISIIQTIGLILPCFY